MLVAVLRSRSRYFLVGAGADVKVGSGSTLDKTEEILNESSFVLTLVAC